MDDQLSLNYWLEKVGEMDKCITALENRNLDLQRCVDERLELVKRDLSAARDEVARCHAEVEQMKARPVEKEHIRLDTMWQQLVRERDIARSEVERLNGKTQYCSECERRQREIDRLTCRRCDGCRNGENSTLYKDHVFCAANDDEVRNDHYCKAWEAKDEPRKSH